MMNVSGRVVACVLFVIFSLEICEASNSSDEEATKYDQRQRGTTNIHVHVSDIGVLGFLGGSLYSDEGSDDGDYDYSYDYEDPIEENGNVSLILITTGQTTSITTTTTTTTTVEPSTTFISADDSSSSITEPSEVSKTNTSFSDTNSTTESGSPSSTTTKHISTTTSTIRTTEKPKPSTTAKPKPSTIKPKPSTTTFKPVKKNQTTSSTEVVKETTSASPVTESSTTGGTGETPSTYKSILAMLFPDAPQQGGNKKQGSRRRCGAGFYRDSRGRCRRVRKPNYQMLQRLPIELPFGIRIPPRPVSEVQEETA